MDPQTQAAQQALDQGTRALQNGELEEAKGFYEQSLKVKETSIGEVLSSARCSSEWQGWAGLTSAPKTTLLLLRWAAHYNLGVVQYVLPSSPLPSHLPTSASH